MWLVVLLCAVAAAVASVELVRRRLVGGSIERAVRTYPPTPTVRVLRDEAELRRAVSRAANAERAVAVRAARRAERLASLAGDPSLASLDEVRTLDEGETVATVHPLDGRSRSQESRSLPPDPSATPAQEAS